MALKMGGQLRVVPSGAIIGWDMTAALAMAGALGIDPLLAAEVLPALEGAVVRGMNQNIMGDLDKDNG